MNFAKNLMKKYGWNEGEGLGKDNQGIKKALRPHMKFDTSGLGQDKANEFKNHWWERVFNDAASNLNVDMNGENVEIGVKSQSSVEITIKSYSVRKLKRRCSETHKNFIKRSVLDGLREKSEISGESESEEELPKYKSLTDEELFAACGGRTAHKGARHGLTLSGKLSRIEKQEHELLQNVQNEKSQSKDDWTVVKSKKKRKREDNQIKNNSGLQGILFTNEYHAKSKKKKKKEKQLDNELSVALNSVGIQAEVGNKMDVEITNSSCKKKRNKSGKVKCGTDNANESLVDLGEGISNKGSAGAKKKNKKTSQEIPENSGSWDFLKSSEATLETCSKRKKRKLKNCRDDVAEDLETSLALVCTA